MMLSVLRSNSVPALVAITALVSTFAVWRYVSGAVEQQQRDRFTEATRVHRNALGWRLAGYEALLRAGRGYVEALGRDPTAEEFRRFVEPLELTRHHLGIQGYGWARMLRPGELEAHVRAERAAGRREYDVWPAGVRELYTSIVHLEPLDWRNRRAIGYDMYSEPVRSEAMARAAETGDVAATGRVELVQEAGPERQAGFLMYAPVYGARTAAGPDRARALRGWVYAAYRVGDLVAAIGPAAPPGTMSLAIYDGERESPEALLYESEEPAPVRPPWIATERLGVAGRTWTLRYAATARFATPWERILPPAVLVTGLVLAALLFWITRDEAWARRRAERAARRAAFLAESGRILAGSLDYERTLPEVARLAASRVTAACAIHVEEPDGTLFAIGHRDPAIAARLEAAVRESSVLADGETAAATAMREGRPERRRIEAGIETLSRHPAVAEALRDAGLQKVLSVPLFVRGEALGAITFLSRRRRLQPEEVAVAEDLARLVVAAIDTSRLYARAQRALQERDDFLSVASHELKTPITSLLLQAEALRNSARRSDAEGFARKAEVIRRNVDRLSRLVASLLDLSRIAAGRLEIELGEVDLGSLVREVVARFADEAERAGCRLVVDVQEPIVGRWDALRLDEVLTNLLANAIKYGPGQPVEIVVRRAGDVALVSVRDHGIGISEADQRRIFERFERAVSKRNYGGFGLGLWISRQIVHGLGGEIHVQSAPGEGSTFTVELRGILDAGGEAAEAVEQDARSRERKP